MPYQILRFDKKERGEKVSPDFVYFNLDSFSDIQNNHLRIQIKSPDSHHIHELKNHSCSLLGFDSNLVKNKNKTTYSIEIKDGDIWKQISAGKVNELLQN